MFINLAEHNNVRAFEIKLAQGAKTRGGHMEGNKVTEEIARIRNVKPYETINSLIVLILLKSNRFTEFR